MPNTDVAGEGEPLSVREIGERVMAGKFDEIFLVRGVVVRAPKPPKDLPSFRFVYGYLRDEGDGAEIAFQCPAEAAPADAGKRAVLEGRVKVWFNGKSTRFELRFTGKKVGTWGVSTPPSSRSSELRRMQPKIGLQELVQGAGDGRVALVGTETCMQDAQGTARRSGSTVEFEKVRANVTNWREMLQAVTQVAARCQAVCLVRGGGDVRDFACWEEEAFIAGLMALGRPFYTALGHSTSQPTLADRCADESFATPSEFGAAYAGAMRAREGAQRVLAEKGEIARRLEQEQRTKYKLRSVVASEQRSRGLAEEGLRVAAAREMSLRKRQKVLLMVAGTLLLLVLLAIAVLAWR
jgi:hypothetical protein